MKPFKLQMSFPGSGVLPEISNLFSKGFLAGLFLTGPLFLIYFFAASLLTLPFPLLSERPWNQLYDPELRSFARSIQNQVVVAGSSEFAATPGGLSVEEHFKKLGDGAFFAGFQGFSPARAAFFLLRIKDPVPDRWILVINPHYATDQIQPDSARLPDIFFPDSEAESFFLSQHPGFFHGRYLSKSAGKGEGMISFLKTGGLYLRRTFVSPLENLIRLSQNSEIPAAAFLSDPYDPEWGMSKSFALRFSKEKRLSEGRRIAADLSSAWYGEALGLLANELRNRPKIHMRILIMPVNRIFYRRIGLNPAEEETHCILETKRILAGSGARVRFLESLAEPGLFYDSIHFTDEGRRRLAGEIRKELEDLQRDHSMGL